MRLLKGRDAGVIYCHYCDASAADAHEAARRKWLSGVWDEWVLYERPVCRDCTEARCVKIRGEYHLDQELCEKADRPKQLELFSTEG